MSYCCGCLFVVLFVNISSLKLSCSYTFSLCMSKYVGKYWEFVFGVLLEITVIRYCSSCYNYYAG